MKLRRHTKEKKKKKKKKRESKKRKKQKQQQHHHTKISVAKIVLKPRVCGWQKKTKKPTTTTPQVHQDQFNSFMRYIPGAANVNV